MTSSPELATADLAAVAPGTHLCAFFDNEERLERIASTFVASSLADTYGASCGGDLVVEP
jgi:hypothetical protein